MFHTRRLFSDRANSDASEARLAIDLVTVGMVTDSNSVWRSTHRAYVTSDTNALSGRGHRTTYNPRILAHLNDSTLARDYPWTYEPLRRKVLSGSAGAGQHSRPRLPHPSAQLRPLPQSTPSSSSSTAARKVPGETPGPIAGMPSSWPPPATSSSWSTRAAPPATARPSSTASTATGAASPTST